MAETEFMPEQHKTWAELYRRQLPKVKKYACQEYLEGFELLALPADEVPGLPYLTSKIQPLTGWQVIRTHTRYSSSEEWYQTLADKKFLVTDYLRSWEELDWTPEPDMFHDIFGHLPFFTLPVYTALQEVFAPAFLRATTEEQRENVRRLAWYTTEFGVMLQHGERKIFGTGLMSGGAEMENAMTGKMQIIPFSVEAVIGKQKVMYEQHDRLFELESIESTKQQVDAYFATF